MRYISSPAMAKRLRDEHEHNTNHTEDSIPMDDSYTDLFHPAQLSKRGISSRLRNEVLLTMLSLCALRARHHPPCFASTDHRRSCFYLNAFSAQVWLQCTITHVVPSLSTSLWLTRRFCGRERLDKGKARDTETTETEMPNTQQITQGERAFR